MTGTIAAKKLLEPFVLNIKPDGAAAVEKPASLGVSIWQSITILLSQAAQSLIALSEVAKNLFAAKIISYQK